MPDWLLQAFTIGGPLVTGFALWMLNHFHEANKERLDRIHKQLDHQDVCLDELKQRVARLEGRHGYARDKTL